MQVKANVCEERIKLAHLIQLTDLILEDFKNRLLKKSQFN